jgi:hypothetical protein
MLGSVAQLRPLRLISLHCRGLLSIAHRLRVTMNLPELVTMHRDEGHPGEEDEAVGLEVGSGVEDAGQVDAGEAVADETISQLRRCTVSKL